MRLQGWGTVPLAAGTEGTGQSPLALGAGAATRGDLARCSCCTRQGRLGSGGRWAVGHAVRLVYGYQTRHRSCGCMGVPWAQWKASEKAARFCSEPSTLRAARSLSQLAWALGAGAGGGGVMHAGMQGATRLYFRGL